jgi:hypothetical protein
MLSWGELRFISEHGIECGAHTHSHPQLDIIPRAGAFAEILRSKASLEDHLSRAVRTFAYPHGYACRATRHLVRQAGFTSACRVRHALSSTEEDHFALSRVIMTSNMEARDLGPLLAGENLPIAPPPDRFLAAGWRLARKVNHSLRRWSERSIGDRRLRPARSPKIVRRQGLPVTVLVTVAQATLGAMPCGLCAPPASPPSCLTISPRVAHPSCRPSAADPGQHSPTDAGRPIRSEDMRSTRSSTLPPASSYRTLSSGRSTTIPTMWPTACA